MLDGAYFLTRAFKEFGLIVMYYYFLWNLGVETWTEKSLKGTGNEKIKTYLGFVE